MGTRGTFIWAPVDRGLIDQSADPALGLSPTPIPATDWIPLYRV